jgi:hypothetical protein
MTDDNHTLSLSRQDHALRLFVVFALLPMILVAVVNFTVDPFQYFRVSHPAQFSNLMQRLQAPGIIRNYDFDTLIVGNSVVANLQNSMFDRPGFPVKPRAMNLSLWGSTIREDAYIVALALKRKPIRTVYWSIGRQGIDEFRYADFPKCMYGGMFRFIPPYCYLLTSSVFWESYVDITDSKDSSFAGWIPELDSWKTFGPHKMDPHAEACRVQALFERDQVDRLTQMVRFGPVRGIQSKRYEEVVLPIVRANPDVRFVFVFSPVYLSQFWQRNVSGSIGTDRALIDLFSVEPNVEIHDMAGLTPITHNLRRYRDAFHYDAEAANSIVAALASGEMKINSIAQHERMLRQELEAGAGLIRTYFKEHCP